MQTVASPNGRLLQSHSVQKVPTIYILIIFKAALTAWAMHPSAVSMYLHQVSRSSFVSHEPSLIFKVPAIHAIHTCTANPSLRAPMSSQSSIRFIRSSLVDIYPARSLFRSFSSVWGTVLLDIAFQSLRVYSIFSAAPPGNV